MTYGFDVSFFARPTIKKSFCLHLDRERAEHRHLTMREEAFSNLLRGKILAYIFDVDANPAIKRERVKGQPVSMRDIEAEQRWPTRYFRQGGFSISIVTKEEPRRFDV